MSDLQKADYRELFETITNQFPNTEEREKLLLSNGMICFSPYISVKRESEIRDLTRENMVSCAFVYGGFECKAKSWGVREMYGLQNWKAILARWAICTLTSLPICSSILRN